MKRQDLLKTIMGEKVLESLNKALVKLNTKSVVDLEELHSAIKTAPKAIMAFLMRELKDMEKDHTKEIKIPWAENSMMTITKLDSDVYKGIIVKDSKIIHEFDLTAIPQLAAHIMSVFEIYDEDDHQEEESSEESSEDSKQDIREHLKALDGKINALMMLIASQSPMHTVQKSDNPEKDWKKVSAGIKKSSLKKAGLMPKMPSPPRPGTKVGGSQGITKQGIHSDKTHATDMPGHEIHTQVKNPWNAAFNAASRDSSQPKQPKQPKQPAAIATKSEKQFTFKKSELESKCLDCNQPIGGCSCFKALSKPQIKKSENDKVTLKFGSDWDQDALRALFHSIKRRKNE
jgi:hypothetical protein